MIKEIMVSSKQMKVTADLICRDGLDNDPEHIKNIIHRVKEQLDEVESYVKNRKNCDRRILRIRE